MRHRTLAVIAFLFFQAACSPSPQAIQTAAAQTASALPTLTPIPISALDLRPSLMVPGDLEQGYVAGPMRTALSSLTKQASAPDYWISQAISLEGAPDGSVDVLVYQDAAKATDAYNSVVALLPGDQKPVQFGEKSASSFTLVPAAMASLVFLRCHAVAAIQMIGSDNIHPALAYATLLDGRLESLLCR
jgi:hypothetical protein